jgi:hypothetical protein
MARDPATKAGIDQEAPSRPRRTRDAAGPEGRRPAETAGDSAERAGEGGGPRSGVARRGPDPSDVSAGPGDAGAQDRPRMLADAPRGDRGGWGRVAAVLGLGMVVMVVLVVLL